MQQRREWQDRSQLPGHLLPSEPHCSVPVHLVPSRQCGGVHIAVAVCGSAGAASHPVIPPGGVLPSVASAPEGHHQDGGEGEGVCPEHEEL